MEFDIKNHTHFLCVNGSCAFGTNVAGSDVDVKGWAIPPKEYLLGPYHNFEQHDQKYLPTDFPWSKEVFDYAKKNGFDVPNEPLDQGIYGLYKFIKLASDANPNIFTVLFADEPNILFMDSIGKELWENRELFLSARVRYTYSGYAVSQLKRIQGHRRWLLNPPTEKPTRAQFNLPEHTTIPADQRQAAERLVETLTRDWLLLETDIERDVLHTITMKLEDFFMHVLNKPDMLQEASLAAYHKLEMSQNFIHILQQEKAYHRAKTEYKQYQDWKSTRNAERAEIEREFGYDTKHSYHLVRLSDMCEEILTTGKVIVKRPDAQKLLDIRNGKWSYDEVVSYAQNKMAVCEEIYKAGTYVVPKKPNIKEIERLCVRLHEKALHV